jgi:outer membrane protein
MRGRSERRKGGDRVSQTGARRTRRIRAAIAATIGAALCLAGTGCQLKAEKPFDPVALQNQYRDRAMENTPRRLTPLPKELDRQFLERREGPAPARVTTGGPTTQQSLGPAVRMKLRDLIHLAAANSLDVKVAGYQPAIEEARVVEAEGRFDPVVFSQLNLANQTILSASPQNAQFPSGNNTTEFETLQFTAGIRQQLANGAQFQHQNQMQRLWRFSGLRDFNGNPTPRTRDRFYENDLQLQITQPLVQNFGTEVNQARIIVARYNQRISLLDWRLQLEQTLAEIEQAYWELVQAERDLRIQEALFEETVRTSVVLQGRVNVDVNKVILSQSDAALRLREASLPELRQRVRTLSNEIKVRVNDPELPVTSGIVILPDDDPIETPIMFDLAEQIETALKHRAELAQQELRIQNAAVVHRAAKNNLLPRLDLVMSMGSKGGGDNWQKAMKGSYVDWLFREYSIGLQFEIPLGNREARGIEKRTMLQRLQSIDQYRLLIERISSEVKTSHDQVISGWERIALSRKARLSARNALDAIIEERDVGQQPLSPDFVNRLLNQQEVLAQAAREEIRALSDYNVAISALERAKGTILKYDNVIMQEEPMVTGGLRVLAGPAR